MHALDLLDSEVIHNVLNEFHFKSTGTMHYIRNISMSAWQTWHDYLVTGLRTPF